MGRVVSARALRIRYPSCLANYCSPVHGLQGLEASKTQPLMPFVQRSSFKHFYHSAGHQPLISGLCMNNLLMNLPYCTVTGASKSGQATANAVTAAAAKGGSEVEFSGTAATGELSLGAQKCSGCVADGDRRIAVANGAKFPYTAIGENTHCLACRP